jgi:hypothetical protein
VIACYELKLENDRLYKISEFVEFCVRNQGQDIQLIVNNEGHCLRNSKVYDILDLFKFKSVDIITCNILEEHNSYNIQNSNWDYWLTNIEDFDYSYDYNWNYRHIFGVVYGRPSAARLGIAGHLVKYHDDLSTIQTKFDFLYADSRSLFDLHRLYMWDVNALEYVKILNNNKYFSSEEYIKGKYFQKNKLSHLYKNFLIDIIVEPVNEGISFYPTEKLTRAILCKRPFIVMASNNYLDYLHQMGFYSFNEFWDEDYDGYSAADRYLKILDLIDKISSWPQSKLIDLYYSMTYQLDHNYNLIVNKLYNASILKIE